MPSPTPRPSGMSSEVCSYHPIMILPTIINPALDPSYQIIHILITLLLYFSHFRPNPDSPAQTGKAKRQMTNSNPSPPSPTTQASYTQSSSTATSRPYPPRPTRSWTSPSPTSPSRSSRP